MHLVGILFHKKKFDRDKAIEWCAESDLEPVRIDMATGLLKSYIHVHIKNPDNYSSLQICEACSFGIKDWADSVLYIFGA